MSEAENKRRPSMTVIIFVAIIFLLASISGWNYYQTNKKYKKLDKKFVMLTLKDSEPGKPLLTHDEPIYLENKMFNSDVTNKLIDLAKHINKI